MGSFLNKLFGVDKRNFKKIEAQAKKVLQYENEIAALSDDELKAKTPYFRKQLEEGVDINAILPEAFAVAREAAKRVLNQFPYFEQICGAVALHNGDVAEMKTGEGKTLTATMCVYLNALTGKGVHVVTVNEYLASRDASWMGEIYRFLGLTVGINARALTPEEKRKAYLCDITYSTNSELGFDYLRDNMAISRDARVLRKSLYMCIIDEADSILIDESRTPLIISGGRKQVANLYKNADFYVKSLKEDEDYTIDIEQKTVTLTSDGVHKAEKMFKLDNLYRLEYTSLVHAIHQALKANYIMAKDVDYMVQDDEIVIVDQFTGRQLKGRTFSDGLHQAIEAKENVTIKDETSVLATITYQNFFRLYEKIGGMTGTAKTEEEEFLETYNMRVIQIPTHRPIARVDATDLVFANKEYKYKAMIEEIKEKHALGQPILVGTISVETSEYISSLLKKEGIKHEVLNAKNHEREADIIKNAGQKGMVTIATNMAGRGTDIKLGEGVKELGGLAVIGSERHESRRIDNQLRGRSGRQGDPGYSRFYVSFEDDLMKRFASDTINSLFKSMGEDPIESGLVSKVISTAQQKVEGLNFDIRKNLLGYDDVLRQQREIMYAQRDKIIDSDDCHQIVKDMFFSVAQELVRRATTYENKEEVIDYDKLYESIVNQYVPIQKVNKYALKSDYRDEVENEVYETMLTFFEENMEKWTPSVFKVVEKQILLRIVDANWTQHIDRMSKLRDGIHLRSYAQTNPLQAYINEGYQMFEDLKMKIAMEVTNYCLHAQVRVQRKEENQENKDEK
ncbi:MAG: preprotein translocase subunit SecA [Bacilli bacterium]|nr:preprotein translocase subunit SecA [Bacilli bacterium]